MLRYATARTTRIVRSRRRFSAVPILMSRTLRRTAEQALWPQQHDQQEDDEDRRVLQLRRQDQGGDLLHEAHRQPAPERAHDGADAAKDDTGIHDDDVVEA